MAVDCGRMCAASGITPVVNPRCQDMASASQQAAKLAASAMTSLACSETGSSIAEPCFIGRSHRWTLAPRCRVGMFSATKRGEQRMVIGARLCNAIPLPYGVSVYIGCLEFD